VFSVSKTVRSLAVGMLEGDGALSGCGVRSASPYRGDRLVPGDYIARMTADTTDTGRAEPDNRTYGLHVWLFARDEAWRMDGIYGQFGIVLPGHHACVSITAHYLGPTTHILDCVWEHIVPALAVSDSSWK